VKPARTFEGTPSAASAGVGGPDQIEHDIDNLCAALDPAKTFSDSSPGGIGWENCKSEVANHKHDTLYAALTHTHDYAAAGHTHVYKPADAVLWSAATSGGISGTADGSRKNVLAFQTPHAGCYRLEGIATLGAGNGAVDLKVECGGVIQLAKALSGVTTAQTFTVDMTGYAAPGVTVTFFTESMTDGDNISLSVDVCGEIDGAPSLIVIAV
jgi:hypothetical protein